MALTFAKFKSICFKNILVFKKEYSIPLYKQGIISVIGINKDTGSSNGAGKSTIFDIMRAIHIGRVSDGTADTQFMSNKGSSFMGYTAKYGNDTYEVTKYRNDKVYKNNTIVLKNEKPVGAKKNAVALKKDINEKYVQLSEAVWDNCVVLRTDKAHTLLQGTPSERIDFISNLCQLNAYDEIEERLKEDLKKVVTAIDELRETQALYADVSRSIGESKSKEELTEELKELDRKKDSLSFKVKDILSRRNACSEKATKISSLLKEVNSIEKYNYEGDYKSAKKELKEKQEKLNNLKSRLDRLTAALALYEQYKSLKSKLKKINAPEKEKSFYDNKVLELSKDNNKIHQDLLKAKEAKDLKKEIDNSKQYNINDLKKELAKYNTEKTRYDLLSKLIGHKYDKCPLCEQVLSKSLNIDENQLNKDRKEILIKIQDVTDKLEDAKKLVSKKSRYIEIKKYDYDSLKSKYDANEETISKYRNFISLKEKEESYKESISDIKSKLKDIDVENIEGDIENLKDRCKVLSSNVQELTALKVSLKRIYELEKELGISSDNAEKVLKKALDLVEQYDIEHEEKNTKLKKILHKIGEYDNSIKTVESLLKKKEKYESELEVLPKLEKKKKFLDALVYCYSNKGLKAQKISKILEALSIRLQEYTSILFSEKDINFEIKADSRSFSIMCVRKDSKGNTIASYDVKRLSGGEKARFTLALVFSLDDLTSPNQRCNFKVLDEVDAKLDEKGKRILLERFIPILKSKCDTLFIVSHDKEVRDSNIFDKKLIVTKENSESTVKLVEVKNVQNG